ncbi:MAG: cysteine hydrolase [Thaumarchaeota archaeon]|nr:cysteine hydrolase [Nitrososphaerota archaeon]
MSSNQIPDSEVVLDPKSTVLLVVDVQNEFVKPGGRFYDIKDQAELDRAHLMVRKLESFLGKCREENLRIIFLQSIRSPDAPEFKAWGTKPHLLEGTWPSQIIDELKPRDNEIVVQKRSHDCFIKPDMEDVFRKLDLRPFETKFIVTGGSISVCSYTAIIGLSQRNYYTVVPIDCSYGLKQGEEFAIKQFSTGAYNYNVALTNSDKIRFESASGVTEATPPIGTPSTH